MLSFIALSLATAALGGNEPAPAWIDAFRSAHPGLSSPTPLEPSVTAAGHVRTHAGASPHGTVGEHVAVGPGGLAAALRAGFAIQFHARQLALAGRYEDAYTYFVSAGPPVSEMSGGDLSLLSTCEVLTARADLAYEQLGKVIERGAWLPDDSYLNLSILCASRGEVYPGQGEFALAKLDEASHSTESYWPQSAREIPNTARKIEIDSALAMGLHDRVWGPGYMELVLKLEPGNATAAHEAVQFYGSEGRYSDLRRVANQMLRRTNEKSEREYYAAELKKVEGLPDKKPEPTKNPYDSAGPPPP